MKMVNKLLAGALVAAALFAFAGCDKPDAGTEGLIKKGSPGNAEINYENTGDTMARGFESLATKHLDGVCAIENTINELEDTSKITNGVMGYIFGIVTDDTDKDNIKYSFSIAGVRYNQKTKKVNAYVESFKDVPKADLEKQLTGGKKAKDSPQYKDANGTNDSSGFGFDLGSKDDFVKDGVMKVWIEVIANDGTTPGRTGTKDTYTVKFFNADPKRKSGPQQAPWDLEYNTGAPEAKITVTVLADNVYAKGDKFTDMEADMGYYANVQPKQTMNGTWKISKTSKEAEEIAE
ncbi:MAG: hypothetical protein IK102_08910 [Treponema sp.]|nr:hypothetical protein [Treponema sp.]